MTVHPTFLTFERRWQLPVYFQLRWKDIVTRLEDCLSTSKLEPASGSKKGSSAPRLQFHTLIPTMTTDSRDQPFCAVLDGCRVVRNDHVLGPECLCAAARTSVLEAYVASAQSLSHVDPE